MCRGKKECTELGTNIALWNKKSPLLPPQWFNEQIDLFEKAIIFASKGEKEKSLKVLLKIRDSDLRDWYCEHGQMSGLFRNKILKIKTEKKDILLDTLRSPDKHRKDVFERDDYICQYCGGKVIPKEIFSVYSKYIGEEFFKATGTNKERHGVVLAFRANADHIIPWVHGGLTNPSNLITSCWSCNYGKSGYTLEELGLSDPRSEKIKNNNWKGLSEYISVLKKLCK